MDWEIKKMVSASVFFTAFGVFSLIILFTAGVIYWLVFLFRKIFPNLKYQIKYNLLKKKYDENMIKTLLDYDQEGLSDYQVKVDLLKKGFPIKIVIEYCYIYEKMKQKGGKINE
jgi:hypothetical protein